MILALQKRLYLIHLKSTIWNSVRRYYVPLPVFINMISQSMIGIYFTDMFNYPKHVRKVDTYRTARQLINTYELHPEIEEDFWKLENFKSIKYLYISYHIVMTLIGYLSFHHTYFIMKRFIESYSVSFLLFSY